MVERNIQVAASLEARPAALFVQLAGKFDSNLKITLENKYTNCKSIMGIISLGIVEGCNVVISAEGSDEEQAVQELSSFLLLERKF